ncbi:MAG: D-alanyl-D-alanine carboxypeptidase family protein [Octadecabacter sp.]
MIRHIATLALLISGAAPLAAQSFDTRASAAYVLDHTTGVVLLEKNAQAPLPPASMSKLMTLYMAFEAIANGHLNVDDRIGVSQHCANYTGSTMFLDTTDRVRVEDLLRGIIVLSGNDASCVIAEGLSGSENLFAQQMTIRARELGMMNSTFANSNGWPAVGHRMSLEDLGILANLLITDFPTFYPLFAEETFAFDGRAPANVNNRNPLLGVVDGADGLKTGHTEEAGYGLVGSAKQGDRRIIFVLAGLDTAQARAEESRSIANWAFRQFAERQLGTAGTRIAEADVWMGETDTVGLTLQDDLTLLVPISGTNAVSAEVIFDTPIEAPIAAGDQIGELVVRLRDLPDTRVPLIADTSVAQGGFQSHLQRAANVLTAKVRGDAEDVPAVAE